MASSFRHRGRKILRLLWRNYRANTLWCQAFSSPDVVDHPQTRYPDRNSWEALIDGIDDGTGFPITRGADETGLVSAIVVEFDLVLLKPKYAV